MRSIPPVERDERQTKLIDDAADLAGDADKDSLLIGYVMLAFYSDGTSRSAGYRPRPADHKIGSAMHEAWARSALESHFAYGEGVDAAYAVLNGEA